MKILVVGGGGREHALAWKLAQSPRVQRVYVAPGNGGTARDRRLQNFPSTDHRVLAAFAEREKIGLTVIGPDAALADGIVDLFQAQKLKVFGPTRAAAELEWSKSFAKGFMARHGIPTASYRVFGDAVSAHVHVDAEIAARPGTPVVIKADALAAGKGVVVTADADEAHAAIDRWLPAGSLGTLVIEGFLEGEEASFFLICDGRTALPFATAQDHKRLLDDDRGPNTGGMGAYSPAPIVSPSVHAKVMQQIVRPTMAGMAAEGRPFSGFLYVGLMIDDHGQPRVVEFNARMGDPETQPIMLRMKSDLVPVLEAAIAGKLDALPDIDWDRRTALTVVLAASGYPEAPRKGDLIRGLPKADADDAVVFHAGTSGDADLRTDGGRVLGVTALGDSVRMAQKRAYEVVETIAFDGMQYRRDIGWRAVARRG